MFEVIGTHFEKGIFEIYLEKPAPKFLNWVFRLGAIPARLIGISILAFSFLFSTSRAPITFMMEKGYASSIQQAMNIQQNIAFVIFGIACLFYMTVFFFRKETMDITFNKGSKLFSVSRTPMFRFTTTQRGHVPFQDLKAIEKITSTPEAPHGKLLIRSEKMPDPLKKVEFKVLTDEQFEYFPLNIERILGQ